MSIDTGLRHEFITLDKADGHPLTCRADRLACILGPENQRRFTTVTVVLSDAKEAKYDVQQKPEDIPGIYASFSGRGGGAVRIRPDFIIAAESGAKDNPGVTVLHTGTPAQQVFYIKDSAEQVRAATEQAMKLLPR